MSLPALATVAEFSSWMGTPIDESDTRAQLLLESASGLVRDAAGRTWVDGNGALLGVHPSARMITLTAAARAWVNPAGHPQQSSGPFAASSDGLQLLPEERRTLALLAANSVPGLSSVRVAAPAGTSPSGLGWDRLQQLDGDE